MPSFICPHVLGKVTAIFLREGGEAKIKDHSSGELKWKILNCLRLKYNFFVFNGVKVNKQFL